MSFTWFLLKDDSTTVTRAMAPSVPYCPPFRYGVNVCGASSLRAKVPMTATLSKTTGACRDRADEVGAHSAVTHRFRPAIRRDIVKQLLDTRRIMTDTPPPGNGAQPPVAAQPSAGYPVAPQYAQPSPGYGVPPGYGGPPVYKNPAEAKNWMNVASLALSLSGLILGVTAIAGIVFGHLGLSAVKRGEANNRGLGLAGLIIGYVLTGLGLLIGIAYVVFMVYLIQECGGDNPASWC
jgi:peptidyl-prolyl cis-trans isomerase B (cyclophilin B)